MYSHFMTMIPKFLGEKVVVILMTNEEGGGYRAVVGI